MLKEQFDCFSLKERGIGTQKVNFVMYNSLENRFLFIIQTDKQTDTVAKNNKVKTIKYTFLFELTD